MKHSIEEIDLMPIAEKYNYLRANKHEIITEKKSLPKMTDPVIYGAIEIKSGKKSDGQDTGIVNVKVIANTANWLDSQMDVIIPGAWNKSIKERKKYIPHLHDHEFSLDAKIGEVNDIFTKQMQLNNLGINAQGSTEVLIFDTDVYKSYNEKIYNQYRLGKINQHSIGLNYIQLEMAINDSTDSEHFENWNKYINQIINKSKALEKGYFWIVKELRLIENSAVLAGANEITPTLEINDKWAGEPPETKPDYSTLINAIKNIKI